MPPGAQEVLGHTAVSLDPPRPSIAIVTTALHPGNSFQRWLDHHLNRCSINKIVVYMDDPLEQPIFETLIGNRNVELLAGTRIARDMTPESRIMVRQEVHVTDAINRLLHEGYEWLLHIDTDELLYEAGGASSWRRLRNIGLVHFTNHEAVPLDHDTDDSFNSTLFRTNSRSNKDFLAYGNGKSAVRLSHGVKPAGPHSFEGYRGDVLDMPANDAAILHYPSPTFPKWVAKYKHYGDFSGYWFDDRYSPIRLQFMLQSRDLVQQALRSGDWDEARSFFLHHCFLEPTARMQALEEGKILELNPFAT
ncbi:glycosyltransferase family 2 protein [Teratosphaeria destructans]|uniref:Glycosyltransferase family 2 protein n=1 Tax=Teratosphaeria destructans TaxID=418781 RepID=A0A9W7W3L1_9PEZI|nr:glycosyltransferase family 2 protein [Teratosphaeria destructans]